MLFNIEIMRCMMTTMLETGMITMAISMLEV